MILDLPRGLRIRSWCCRTAGWCRKARRWKRCRNRSWRMYSGSVPIERNFSGKPSSCRGPRFEAPMSRSLGSLSRPVVIAALATLVGVLLAPAAAAPPRIVSMNVCADQLLIPLADPEQILGLSRYSRDAWQSFAADDARRYPMLSGGAEDVLVLRPDIVVAGLFDKRSTRELLKEKGLRL